MSYEPRAKSKAGLYIGIAVGVICICCVIPFGALGGLGFFAAKQVVPTFECVISLQAMQTALTDFAAAHNGKLPNAKSWQDELRPFYAKAVKDLPADSKSFKPFAPDGDWGCKAGDDALTGIAFNLARSGKKLADIKDPESTIVLFEIEKNGKNLSQDYSRRTSKGPAFAFGEKRGWIEVPIKGEVVSPAPDGRSMTIKTGDGGSGWKVNVDSKDERSAPKPK